MATSKSPSPRANWGLVTWLARLVGLVRRVAAARSLILSRLLLAFARLGRAAAATFAVKPGRELLDDRVKAIAPCDEVRKLGLKHCAIRLNPRTCPHSCMHRAIAHAEAVRSANRHAVAAVMRMVGRTGATPLILMPGRTATVPVALHRSLRVAVPDRGSVATTRVMIVMTVMIHCLITSWMAGTL